MREKGEPVQVLFVCLGNICRSPMAEGIFRHLVEARGLSEQITIDSAGTGDWHVGQPPDRRACKLMQHRGIDIGHLRGRQVKIADFGKFDYILAMDDSNYRMLAQMLSPNARAKLMRMTDFAPELNTRDVPDPFEGGDDEFVFAYDLIEASCQGLLNHIEEHDLPAETASS